MTDESAPPSPNDVVARPHRFDITTYVIAPGVIMLLLVMLVCIFVALAGGSGPDPLAWFYAWFRPVWASLAAMCLLLAIVPGALAWIRPDSLSKGHFARRSGHPRLIGTALIWAGILLFSALVLMAVNPRITSDQSQFFLPWQTLFTVTLIISVAPLLLLWLLLWLVQRNRAGRASN